MDGHDTSIVLGERWDLGPALRAQGRAVVHEVRLSADPASPARLAEIHPVSAELDPLEASSDIRRANEFVNPALLTVFEVGLLPDASNRLYVITEGWTQPEKPATVATEAELRAVALHASAGLAALHERGIVHGGLHRGSLRRVGERWKLAPAGMGPLLQVEVAAYRPPGLHVMEPLAPPADVWNLGVMLHELSTGRLLSPGQPPSLSDLEVVDHLVGELLQRDPTARPTARAVYEMLQTGASSVASATHKQTEPRSEIPRADPQPAGATQRGVPAGEIVAAAGAADDVPVDEAPNPRRLSASALLMAATVGLAVVALGLVAIVLVRSDSPPDQRVAGADDDGGSGDAGVTGDGISDDSVADDSVADGRVADDEASPAPAGPATAEVDRPTEGTIAVGALQTGDCLDAALGQGLLSMVDLQPCDAAHRAEVIAVATPPSAGAGVDYPGRQALILYGSEVCDSAFTSYVGFTVLDTILTLQPVLPTFGEWESGDRQTIVCLAGRFDGAPIEGSVAGAYTRFRIVEGQVAPVGKLLTGRCFDSFAEELSAIGKRQTANVIGCLNLHSFEVIDFQALPVEEADETGEDLEPERVTEFVEHARDHCRQRWSELTELPGAPEATVLPVLPDVFDWQVGDRTFICVVAWQGQVANSVVLNDAFVESDEGG